MVDRVCAVIREIALKVKNKAEGKNNKAGKNAGDGVRRYNSGRQRRSLASCQQSVLILLAVFIYYQYLFGSILTMHYYTTLAIFLAVPYCLLPLVCSSFILYKCWQATLVVISVRRSRTCCVFFTVAINI